ncbi:MAG TPA: tryptophan--tRNA ligase [Microthrixaceae bacterium]|nr:tryptophan--tRNA ligase [Microthrixaceae bacterium]
MARVFSGIQPTGDLHLGNYLGAVVNWVRDLDRDESIFCIVDLHAITIPQDPAELKARSRNLAALLMACGLDPERCILFVQSHVPQHAQLAWLMQSVVSYGELGRMTQFKDKSDQHKFVSAGLFTYPALQAADILLYDTEKVPVGADQKQHIELCRDAAERFNGRYGTEEQPIFVMPVHSTPAAGARVMDLQHPDKKMSKSLDSPQGTVLVLDDPKAIEKKFKRAVTDSEGVVRYAPDDPGKAGVTNLLSILAGATGDDPEALASKYEQYGPLKADAAAAVIEQLVPIQERYATLVADPAELDRLLAVGADKAEAIASPVLHRATTAMGLGRG